MINILVFYIVLFAIIFLLKKYRYKPILLNCIWFSADGSVSDDAVDNLQNLSRALKHFGYHRYYQLVFWTDKKKLNPQTRKKFSQHKIKINDYTSAFLDKDVVEKNTMMSLLKLGDAYNRLFYVLASDILRFYLLFKSFPIKRPNAIVCYFDCNDIELKRIPHPSVFKRLKNVAFRFTKFHYQDNGIFLQLLKDKCHEYPVISNDLIAVNTHKNNRLLFTKIFDTYVQNFQYIQSKEMLDALIWTQKLMPYIENDLVVVMIFVTTHMMNILWLDQSKSYLLAFNSDGLKKEFLSDIQNISDYFAFDCDLYKGFTCLDRDSVSQNAIANNAEKETCREFWYQCFMQRYQLIQDLFPHS